MHIDSLSLFHVALPRKAPKIIAGRPCETLETVLVKLTSGGAVGWGEAAPGNAPTGNSEWAAGAFAVLRDWLAPAVVKTEIDSGKTLAERLAPFRGNQHAKAALDIAWWDLSARMQDRPLHELLALNLPSPPAPLPRTGEGSYGRSRSGRAWIKWSRPTRSWRRLPPPSRPAFGGSSSRSGRAGPWKCSAACGRSSPARRSISTAKGR